MLLLFLTLLTFVVFYQWRRFRSNPRGPIPLPLVGNLPQLIYYGWTKGGTIGALNELKKVHGGVFTIWIGAMPIVFLSDYDLAHVTHVKKKHVFGNRLEAGVLNWIREGRGLLMSNGEFWQEHRRFAIQTLRNFGMGRNVMEGKIMDEFRYRFEDFAKSHSKNGAIEVEAGAFFDLLVGSIINQLLVSERFEKNDEDFEKLKNSIAVSFEQISLLDFLIPLQMWKSTWMNWRSKTVLEPFNFVYELTRRTISKKVAAMEKAGKIYEEGVKEEGNDFVEAFLLKMEEDKRNNVQSSFNLETLALDTYDLWFGGQETTSTTLTWACAIFLNYPNVVARLYEELHTLTDGARPITLADRPQTRYLCATVNEIQRYASILNVNILRVMKEDAWIGDQPIAAGTVFATQMSMMHSDEAVFAEHTTFEPRRFLKNAELEKRLIPFGIGKRACPGESLARAELYLIIGNMVLDYDLEAVGEKPALKSPSPFATMNRPPSFKIRFVPRSK